MVSVQKKVIDYFDYDSDSTISETESNEEKDNVLNNSISEENSDNLDNRNVDSDNQNNATKENINSASNQKNENRNSTEENIDFTNNQNDKCSVSNNNDSTEENSDLDNNNSTEENTDSDNDLTEENTNLDNQSNNSNDQDVDPSNEHSDNDNNIIDEKKDDLVDIKEIQIENFFTKEYKGTTLTKKVKDDFYIFGDNNEKEKYLVFCKIIESEINSFREKIERESFGPWPITESDHIKVIENMKIFGYKSVEYYVGSLKSGSIEKMRTIVLDEKLLEYLKSKRRGR